MNDLKEFHYWFEDERTVAGLQIVPVTNPQELHVRLRNADHNMIFLNGLPDPGNWFINFLVDKETNKPLLKLDGFESDALKTAVWEGLSNYYEDLLVQENC